jgi:hypothetical protein
VKAQIDENVPRSLARAVHAIAQLDDDEVVHVRDLVEAGTKDVELFELAAKAGIEAHVTQDHHQRRAAEREAVARLGLTVFVLSKGWRQLNHYDRAARLLEWWPKMRQLVRLTSRGSIYSIPHLRASSGRIRPIKPS